MTACRVVVVREIGEPHRPSRASGSRRGSPTRSTACTSCSSRAAAARRPRSTRRARRTPRSSRPRPSRPAACSRASSRTRGVRLEPDAAKRIVAHLGDDAGRVPGARRGARVDVRRAARRSTSTTSRRTSASVGTAGRVRAHERDREAATSAPRSRCCTGCSRRRARAQPKPMHPLQIMASLVCHYQRLLRLDDPVDHDEGAGRRGARHEAAPAARGSRSRRRSGSAPTGSARRSSCSRRPSSTCAGASGLDERTVIEVLVARLAALSRRHRPASRAAAGAERQVGDSASALARFIRRDVRRAAWFLWMTPLAPALPRRFCAARTSSAASSAPVGDAVVGDLDPRLQLGADALVAVAPALVLAVALLLALDVRHATPFSRARSEPGQATQAARVDRSGDRAASRENGRS